MFVAMNRFKVQKGSETAFEEVWKGRDRRLSEMPGFVQFNLLRSAENAEEGYTLFASHTVWKSQDDFTAWTKSEQFRDAHRGAGNAKVTYLGHPQFEGFTAVEGA